MDQFKRLLDEACPNHAYPIRHQLKDYSTMRSFMTSGSLTWGAELDEGPDGSNMTLIPKENTIMIVYGRRPLLRRRRISGISRRTPTRYGWG
jgi:hypothetical protein